VTRADEFRFRGGRLSLDFTATLAGRLRNQLEQLAEPADLGLWLFVAGVLDGTPEVRASELVAARQLREAIYRLVCPSDTGSAMVEADVATLNGWAARPGVHLQLSGDARSAARIAACPVEAGLSALAADTIDLLSGPQLQYVRRCTRSDCSVLFIDTSRAQQRRWCDMARCGNRAKASRHRSRQKEGELSTR